MNYLAIHHGSAFDLQRTLKKVKETFCSVCTCVGWFSLFQRKNRHVGERFLKAKKRVGCQSPKSFKRKFDTVATTPPRREYSLPASMYTLYTTSGFCTDKNKTPEILTHKLQTRFCLLVKWCQIPVRKG
jgi:hypothetical protein